MGVKKLPIESSCVCNPLWKKDTHTTPEDDTCAGAIMRVLARRGITALDYCCGHGQKHPWILVAKADFTRVTKLIDKYDCRKWITKVDKK